MTVQFGWPVGMPVCRPMKNGLFEVRTASGGQVFRVLFCIEDEAMVILHGFVKKTQKTPDADLRLARARQRAWGQEL